MNTEQIDTAATDTGATDTGQSNTGQSSTGPGGTDPEVTAYIGLVRLALRDLAPEDLEDLTGGLEADLAELAAESEEPLIARLGEPSAYAEELRSAAGFPPPGPPPAPPREPRLGRVRRSWRERWDRWRTAYPWLEQLRPLWWLLRGAILASFVVWLVLGVHSPLGLLLVMVLGGALSFWVGQRQAAFTGWRSLALLGANTVALVLAVPYLLSLGPTPTFGQETVYVESGSGAYPWPAGVSVGGEQVASLFVYDADGQRVDGARIFTDQGTQLTVDPWMFYDGTGEEPTTSSLDTFPVESGPLDGWDGWTDPDWGRWQPPVAIPPAFPLVQPTAPEATVTPDPSTPTVEPSGSPSPEPTAP